MITGAHSVLYSNDPESDRAFFRDTIGLPNVDVGDGWLIFGLPPAELAVHPSDVSGRQEFYLMCDDIVKFISDMEKAGISCSDINEEPWGRLIDLALPGGGLLGVYQPHHESPEH